MAASPRKAERIAKAKPRKIGRPTKYVPEMCDLVIELGKQGKSITAMANACDVSRETMYTWMDIHPEFLDAIKRARGHAQQWWEDTGQEQARGDIQGNATAMIFMMKNQFPDDYRDRREVDHSGELKVVAIDFTGFEEDDD